MIIQNDSILFEDTFSWLPLIYVLYYMYMKNDCPKDLVKESYTISLGIFDKRFLRSPPLAIVTKLSILDVWRGPDHASCLKVEESVPWNRLLN